MMTRVRRRGFRGLELAALSGMGAAFLAILALDYALYDLLIWEVAVLAMVALVAAGLVATRNRWMPALGFLVAAAILYGALREPFVVMRLTNPENAATFIATVLLLICNLSALVGGIGALPRATVRARHKSLTPERARGPRRSP